MIRMKCEYCGQMNDAATQLHCTECGAPLPDPDTPPAPKTKLNTGYGLNTGYYYWNEVSSCAPIAYCTTAWY